MTPPRLVELECPGCCAAHWVIDSDFRASYLIGGVDVGYGQRAYACPACGYKGAGYQVLRKSPTAFLLQPHPTNPMPQFEFDLWAGILADHFPEHPLVQEIGHTFVPDTGVIRSRIRHWWRYKVGVRGRARLLNYWYEVARLFRKRSH